MHSEAHECGTRNSLKFCCEGKNTLPLVFIIRFIFYFLFLYSNRKKLQAYNLPVSFPHLPPCTRPCQNPRLGRCIHDCSTLDSSTVFETGPFPLLLGTTCSTTVSAHSYTTQNPSRDTSISVSTYTDSSYAAQIHASVPICSALKEVLP